MGVKRLRFKRNVLRLAALVLCSRDRVWSPELSSAGLSGDRGVVDVSPEECLNSTDDTKRSFGGWALNGACCRLCEWDNCDVTPDGRAVAIVAELVPWLEAAPEPDAPPAPIRVGAEPIAWSPPLWLSLVVWWSLPVELLESDSRGGCSVCWDSVSLGVQMPPEPLRESIGAAETCEWVACPVVVPVKIEIKEGRCWDLLCASVPLVAAGVSLFFWSELSRSVRLDK